MALSYNEYTADGTQTLFASKPYLQEEHLVVSVDGVVQPTSAYTVSGTAVTLNVAPAATAKVRIGRNTSQSLRLTDYADASLLTADVLDADANQLFFMTQEAIDTASETNLAGVTFYNSSATAPADPSVGDLWYDTYNKYLQVYNGTEWQLATPSNETLTFETFSTEGSYSYINVAGLNEDVFVFLNGVKQVKDSDKANLLAVSGAKDFFLDLTNSRVYFKTLASSDVVQVILAPADIGNNQSTQLESFTATAGQTVFNLVNSYIPATNTLHVYVNGVRQSAYTETNATAVTFTSGLTLGDEVVFITNQYVQAQSFTAATNVTYTSAGTGAVATTVQEKLQETVSVKDFGAVGDGVTDDTAAFTAAATAALSLKATLVYPKPDATYLLNSNPVIPDNMNLVGSLSYLSGTGRIPAQSFVALSEGVNPSVFSTKYMGYTETEVDETKRKWGVTGWVNYKNSPLLAGTDTDAVGVDGRGRTNVADGRVWGVVGLGQLDSGVSGVAQAYAAEFDINNNNIDCIQDSPNPAKGVVVASGGSKRPESGIFMQATKTPTNAGGDNRFFNGLRFYQDSCVTANVYIDDNNACDAMRIPKTSAGLHWTGDANLTNYYLKMGSDSRLRMELAANKSFVVANSVAEDVLEFKESSVFLSKPIQSSSTTYGSIPVSINAGLADVISVAVSGTVVDGITGGLEGQTLKVINTSGGDVVINRNTSMRTPAGAAITLTAGQIAEFVITGSLYYLSNITTGLA